MSYAHLTETTNTAKLPIFVTNAQFNTSASNWQVRSTDPAQALLCQIIPTATEARGIALATSGGPATTERAGLIVADANSLRIQTGYQPNEFLPIRFILNPASEISSNLAWGYQAIPAASGATSVTSDTTLVLATFTGATIAGGASQTMTWTSSELKATSIVRVTIHSLGASAAASDVVYTGQTAADGSVQVTFKNPTATATGAFSLVVLLERLFKA